MFWKIAVQITERSTVHVYTDMTCTIDDKVVIETKGGLVRAQIVDISEPIDYDPFIQSLIEEVNKRISTDAQ